MEAVCHDAQRTKFGVSTPENKLKFWHILALRPNLLQATNPSAVIILEFAALLQGLEMK